MRLNPVTSKLAEYANALSMKDAKFYMRRMVDSGLWVPQEGEHPGTALVDSEEEEEEEEEEKKEMVMVMIKRNNLKKHRNRNSYIY